MPASVFLLVSALASAGCRHRSLPPIHPKKPSNAIVQGARDQLSWGTHYYSAYIKIPYPGGDVPRNKGVCTDVVIRAFRHAGYDLQVLVHEDILRPGSRYPVYRSSKGPDTSIDHRRCPNLRRFFQRHGKDLPTGVGKNDLATWKPGDIVFWKLNGGLDHVGIVSDVKNRDGIPFVIHNIDTPAEEDALQSWRIVGHFRYPPEGVKAAASQSKTRA